MKIEIKKIIDILKEDGLYQSSNLNNLEGEVIENITTDSRYIEKKCVFIAVSGFEQDGHNYISQAIGSGAELIIHSHDMLIPINSIQVSDTRKAGALIALELYGKPSEKVKLIGVTGTNGKTTTANIIADILNKMDVKCGMIGTLGYSYDDKMYSLLHTTPDFIELNKILAEMVGHNCQVVVMEVSSHALVLDRVYGQKFYAVGFTNLTQDHMDFHKNKDNYFQAKKILFDVAQDNNAFAVFNGDDPAGKLYYQSFQGEKILYGLNINNDVSARIIEKNSISTKFLLKNKLGEQEVESNYIGKFNLYNILLAYVICQRILSERKIPNEVLLQLKSTPGRLEQISSESKGKVFIDYAHTPDAIEQVLKTLGETKEKRLITVVGCGGERDKNKRSIMGKIACQFSDLVIFTDDNPRRENANLIIADIISELNCDNYFIIRQRNLAVECALDLAKSNDIVIILGKGHENYQEINGKRLQYSDSEEIKKYKPKQIANEMLALPFDVINIIAHKHRIQNSIKRDDYKDLPKLVINKITTDTRQAEDYSLFVALKGDKFDGNNYIAEFLTMNPSSFAIGEIAYESDRYVQVKDPLQFFGFLARKYLKLFEVKKIAITGSTGKTTTKEILANILQESNSILKTHGNENNYIGVPKTIFRIRKDDRYAIFEIGTNNFGEISYLSDIIDPDLGVITSIDESHLEKLRNIQGVFQEKITLFNRKLDSFFFPGDNNLFKKFMVEEYRKLAYSVGQKNDNRFIYKVEEISHTGMKIKVNNSSYEVNSIIPYYAINFAFAISIAKMLSCSVTDIVYGLKKKLMVNNRMNIICNATSTIIADCYNANPKSTSEAIKFWYNYEKDQVHTLVLGDMLELGDKTVELHLEIKKHIKQLTNIKLYTVGKITHLYNGDAHFSNVDEFIDSEKFSDIKNGIVLIKGSHGINLDKILEYL